MRLLANSKMLLAQLAKWVSDALQTFSLITEWKLVGGIAGIDSFFFHASGSVLITETRRRMSEQAYRRQITPTLYIRCRSMHLRAPPPLAQKVW
jgi:hypothetical protein